MYGCVAKHTPIVISPDSALDSAERHASKTAHSREISGHHSLHDMYIGTLRILLFRTATLFQPRVIVVHTRPRAFTIDCTCAGNEAARTSRYELFSSFREPDHGGNDRLNFDEQRVCARVRL